MRVYPAVLTALVVAGLAFRSEPAMAAAAEPVWAATWQASPEPPRAPTVTLNNQTVRQVVRISLGGSRFRVRLTNEYNDNPLRIGAAHVALAAAPVRRSSWAPTRR